MTVFKVMLAGAALWPVLFLLASQRDPPTPAPTITPDTLAERWPETQIAPKADRLPIAVAAEPAPLAVEAPVRVAAARTDVLQTVGATASVRRHIESNVCTRHGMRKVETHGGRSWRCRR